MADEQVVAPEGGNTPEPTLWQKRGFASEGDMEKAFDKYKSDIGELKTEMKALREKAKKADEYETQKAQAEEAQLSEVEKLTRAYQALLDEKSAMESEFSKERKQNLFERTISPRLSGAGPEEAKLLRRLYEAEALKGFEDDKQLAQMLDEIDKDWAASKPKADNRQQPPIPGLSGVGAAMGQQNPYDQSFFNEMGQKASRPKSRSRK